jgi:ribosome-associated heat shock protein Hsp15
MEDESKVRIDKWLWAARFFKTRAVASDAVKGGKVELNGLKPKPSKTVVKGDKLVITQVHRKVEIEIVTLSDKRGNAETAQSMYKVLAETLLQRKPTADMALVGYREKGKGRPTKRERRQIDGFIGF